MDFSYAVNLGTQTSSVLNVVVAYHGIQIDNHREFIKLSIEGDSKNTIMILKGEVSPF